MQSLQLVTKFPAFHGTPRFITALTSARHLSLSWANPIQSIYPHPTSWRSILILSTHLRLGLPSGRSLYLYLIYNHVERNHCCRGKAKLHILSVCVCSLSYPACKAHASYYIVPCGLSGSTIFSHCHINLKDFGVWGGVIEHKMCFELVYNFSLKHFSLLEELSEIRSKKYTGLHARWSLSLSDMNET